ncbi:MAG: hypothetical protein FWF12_01975 [Betaproteobacteria bacterium]|nr:hypothetical protein [Betaproteobacteria bacterium]
MPAIPSAINGVQVEVDSTAVNNVSQRLIDALHHVIRPDIAKGYSLQRVFISSTNDSGTLPGWNGQPNGVDISRLNTGRVQGGYEVDPAVRAFVDSIQERFEEYPFRRENFGPLFNKRNGQDCSAGGHRKHLHLSVS